ncbi:MAG: PilC/PilY family type IV pilus protein, partial [Desulfosarcinaceae bacterium]
DGMDNNGNGLTDEPGESDPDIGFSYPRAYAVNANSSGDDFCPVVIFGNGYGSESQKAALYILDAEKGTLLRKIDTGADNENGLSSPALIDVNMDRRVDYAYAGDLNGNLWKFDLTAEDPLHWGLAYGSDLNGDGVIDAAAGDLALPVFRAPGRSITTRPNVMRMHAQCGPQLPGFMVLFGTGRYLGASDRLQPLTDALFGVWDYGDDGDDSEVLGDLPEDADGRLSSGLRLVRQQVLGETGQGGEAFRLLSDFQPDYAVAADSLDGDGYDRNNRKSEQDGDPLSVAGWYLELPAEIQEGGMAAERIIQDLELRNGMVIAASFVPDAEACSSGGYSWLYLLGGCSGIPLKDQKGEALLPWRHPTAVSGNLIINKSDPTSSRDVLIFTDQQGKLSEKEFPGEKWGKRFWRENMIE